MLRITGTALALLIGFSIVPLATSDAGGRTERHRIVKHQKFRMVDRSARRHDGRHLRVVNRNVVVVKVDMDARRPHRRHRQGDTYSGDVVIDVRSGVGQWSYGALGADAASAVTAPALKIIDVGTLKPDSACAMEAGVCVIRP